VEEMIKGLGGHDRGGVEVDDELIGGGWRIMRKRLEEREKEIIEEEWGEMIERCGGNYIRRVEEMIDG
jgi:hypothetical protein